MNDFHMAAVVIEEAGYSSAIIGLAKNKKISTDRAIQVAKRLAPQDGGHNKFLESIYVWVDVRAPRDWWVEADTYRMSTKNSESTMHTLIEELRPLIPYTGSLHDLTRSDQVQAYVHTNFEDGWDSITPPQLLYLIRSVEDNDPLYQIKRRLPEGFLQSRTWCFNYKTLKNIIDQRQNHRMPHWPEFIRQLREQVKHPELLPNPYGDSRGGY